MSRQSWHESRQSKWPLLPKIRLTPASWHSLSKRKLFGPTSSSQSLRQPGQRARLLAHVALGVAAAGAEREQLHQLAPVVLVRRVLLFSVPESQSSIAGSRVTSVSRVGNEPSAVLPEELVLADHQARVADAVLRRSRTSRARRASSARRAGGSCGPSGRATRAGRGPRRRTARAGGRPRRAAAGPRSRSRPAGGSANGPRAPAPCGEPLGLTGARAETGAPEEALGLRLAERSTVNRRHSLVIGGASDGLNRPFGLNELSSSTDATAVSAIRVSSTTGSCVVRRWSASPGSRNPARPGGERPGRAPELHRQREGGARRERRVGRRRGRPEAVGEHGDGEHERREVRPAARCEPRRLRALRPRSGRAAGLGRGDRAVLGAVKEERPAAQHPCRPGRRRSRFRAEARRLRQEDERQRREQRGEQKHPLAPARDAPATEERGQRQAEPRPSRAGAEPGARSAAARASALPDVPSRPANAQKRSLAITTPSARAIPPSLGGRGAGRRVRGRSESGRDPPDRIARWRPPGKGRAAYSAHRWAYQRPRLKKPSSSSTRTMIRMIQRIDTRWSPFRLSIKNGKGAHPVTQKPKIGLTRA